MWLYCERKEKLLQEVLFYSYFSKIFIVIKSEEVLFKPHLLIFLLN